MKRAILSGLLLGSCLAASGRAAVTISAKVGEVLEAELAQAKSSIDLQLPYLSDPGLLQALTRVASRGLPLRVILDPGSKANRESAAALTATGASLRWLSPGLNAGNLRLLLVDRARACLGSFNGSKTSLRQRHESLACIEDAASQEALQAWFEKAWALGLSEAPERTTDADKLEALPDPRGLVENEPRVSTRRKGGR